MSSIIKLRSALITGGFQDANKMFRFLYMDMSDSMAAPQRAELMERVGVIPYLNDRQERIKREC